MEIKKEKEETAREREGKSCGSQLGKSLECGQPSGKAVVFFFLSLSLSFTLKAQLLVFPSPTDTIQRPATF